MYVQASQQAGAMQKPSSPSPPKKLKLAGGNANSVPSSYEYDNLQEQRRKLPIWPARKKLLKEVSNLSCGILIGETGSGKTTQIPQFLYEAGYHQNRIIACTQPRRVAAVTMAQRVAAEKGSRIGELVGHCVRFDDSTSNETKIKYMTDGMLLREAILDPLLKRYSVIILDEAHERTIHTDVLFGVVKAAQRNRVSCGYSQLKILVMSATMDVDHFSRYFHQAPVLYLEGRQHPVTLMYAQNPQNDYLFAAMVTVFQLHKEAPLGQDILVFLTGQEEIEASVRSMRSIAQDLPSDSPRLHVVPLYAALPPAKQLRAFQPAPQGTRKVILSTNIAETSVTIHGIKFVVDTGMVKRKHFQVQGGLDLLKVQRISQAQAWQRTGRAGRQSPGTCYRLYTEAEFQAMPYMTIPDIQRCNLASVVLQLLAMGIQDVLHFDFMDKPKQENLEAAVDQLHLLGAITRETNELSLTELGSKMVAFPLDPCLARALLAAEQHGCMEEMLTIVSLLSVDSVLFTPSSKRVEVLSIRRKFMSSEADHLTFMNIYRGYKGVNGNKHWCNENFVNSQNLRRAVEVRRQIRDVCVQQQLELKSCGQNTTAIRKSLCAGFFMQAAELQANGIYNTLSTRKPVTIHPSSSLFMSKPAYVIYNELVETTKCYMRSLCVVDADWLYEVAPEYFRKKKHTKMWSST